MNFLTLEAGEAIYVPADCPRKYLQVEFSLAPAFKCCVESAIRIGVHFAQSLS